MKIIRFFKVVTFAMLLFLADVADAQRMTDKEKAEMTAKRLEMDSWNPHFEGMILKLTELHIDDILPPILERVRDEDEDEKVRINGVYIIGRQGPKAEKAVPVLTRILSSQLASDDLKAVTAAALARIGRNASSATTTLSTLLFHEDKWLEAQVIKALTAIKTRNSKKILKEYYLKKEALERGEVYVPPQEDEDE